MWKLLPVKDSTFYKVEKGKKYRVRRATNTIFFFNIQLSTKGNLAVKSVLNIYDIEDTLVKIIPLFVSQITISSLRTRFRHLFEGLAIDIFDEDHVEIFEKEETVTPKKKEEPKKEQFIIWCPSSDLPPRKIIHSEKVAKAVALEMSKRHKKDFCWCRIEGIVKSQKKVEVTYTEVVTEF